VGQVVEHIFTAVPMATIGGVVLLIVLALIFAKSDERRRKRLLRKGAPANAHVFSVERGRVTKESGGERFLQLRLTVEVRPAGGQPYKAEFTDMVSELRLSHVQRGATIAVRIDPADPQSIAIETL
jgi:hypothetical protein